MPSIRSTRKTAKPGKPVNKKAAPTARKKSAPPGRAPKSPAAGRSKRAPSRGVRGPTVPRTPRAAQLAAGPGAVRPRRPPVKAPARRLAITDPADVRLRLLMDAAAGVALDKKAEALRKYDLRALNAFTDFLLIASGDSGVQNRAIAAGIEEKLRESHGARAIGVEGLGAGDWVLLDYGGLVINIFTPAAREHFALERLWADAEKLA